MLRLIETDWACWRCVGVEGDFAGPQLREFKRWAAKRRICDDRAISI